MALRHNAFAAASAQASLKMIAPVTAQLSGGDVEQAIAMLRYAADDLEKLLLEKPNATC